MTKELEVMYLHLCKVHQLDENEWADLSKIWKPMSTHRKELLTTAGSVEKYLYFVLEGVQRVYYFDDHSREATMVFTYAPSFGGVLDSLMLQVPSKYYYETLTASTLLRAPQKEVHDLMLKHQGIEMLIRKGVTHALSGVLQRLTELQCFSAEDRFRQLLTRSPHVLQLVPHKYLANYIGIDATNFSKFVNKIKI